MKISEILGTDNIMRARKADVAMMEWLDKYVRYTDTVSYDVIPINSVRVEKGIIKFENVKPTDWGYNIHNKEGTKHVNMTIEMQGEKFNPPLPIVHGSSIFVDDQIHIGNAIIDDWSKLLILERNYNPRLAIMGAKSVIKSWKGLDTIGLNSLNINYESNESVKIECSLMPLVALNAYIGYHAYSDNHDPLADQLDQAFDFLYNMKNSGKGSEFEFQEYLVDHNLEQFA